MTDKETAGNMIVTFRPGVKTMQEQADDILQYARDKNLDAAVLGDLENAATHIRRAGDLYAKVTIDVLGHDSLGDQAAPDEPAIDSSKVASENNPEDEAKGTETNAA